MSGIGRRVSDDCQVVLRDSAFMAFDLEYDTAHCCQASVARLVVQAGLALFSTRRLAVGRMQVLKRGTDLG